MTDATAPETATRPRVRAAGPALASALLALLLYAVTLGGTFVYDDVFISRGRTSGCTTRRGGWNTGRATISPAGWTSCTGRWCR